VYRCSCAHSTEGGINALDTIKQTISVIKYLVIIVIKKRFATIPQGIFIIITPCFGIIYKASSSSIRGTKSTSGVEFIIDCTTVIVIKSIITIAIE